MQVLSEEAIHCFSERNRPVYERAGAGDVRRISMRSFARYLMSSSVYSGRGSS
jgi:hypothetical protein